MLPVSLADVIFWIAVACCAVAQWYIVRLALVTPDPGRDAPPPAGRLVPATRRAFEIAWTVLPALVLALVLAATWRAIHPKHHPDSTPPAEHTAGRGLGRGLVRA